MDLFSWLIVGHLVGDWLLQNDWITDNKHRGLTHPTLLVHCLIYTLVLLVAIALGARGAQPTPVEYVAIAVLLYVTHWLIDGFQLSALWGRIVGQSDKLFVRIMADQTMHVLVIVVLVGLLAR